MAEKDFAKIVRASNGQQVLYYIETNSEEGCDVVHQVSHFDGFTADLTVTATEHGTETGSLYKYLAKVSVKNADALIAHITKMMSGNANP